jgi:hypothetical protein
MRRQVAGWVLAGLAVNVSGCQSWSQVGQGIPSGARVPPPGTGTYSVPSSYYNNAAGAKTGTVSTGAQPAAAAGSAATGASNNTAARTAAQPLSANSAGSTAAAPATATTAAWQVPTVDQMRAGVNNTASAVFDDVGNRANQVVQAGTARAASAIEKYTDPAPSLRPAAASPASAPATSPQPSAAAASRSLSDDAPADEPQLDWQAPQ